MNPGILTVLALALLPAVGNFGGGLLAEWLRPSKAILNRALHAAAGIILAVIAVKVMPEALRAAPGWLLALAFLAGGGLHSILEARISRWQGHSPQGAGAEAWMVYLAVASDLLGDGLLIGTGSAVSIQLASLLAIGQVLADVPEGYAVIANFRARGVGSRKRLALSASFAIPVISAALFAFLVLRGLGNGPKMAALVFVAGLYTLAAVEDMLHEAHQSAEDTRWSAISFLAGFALFLAIAGGAG